ncbi:MAG TPA: SgcJ/EcaC family oxidoreductase, partial [Pseudonocardia sp.]
MRETDLAAEDVSALNDMLRNMEASWARGDGAGYAADFTDDARYVTASGTRAVGRQDIAATHQKIFDSAFRGTTLGVSYPVEL